MSKCSQESPTVARRMHSAKETPLVPLNPVLLFNCIYIWVGVLKRRNRAQLVSLAINYKSEHNFI